MTFESQSASQNFSDEPRAAAGRARPEDFLDPAQWAVINTARGDGARYAGSAGVLTRLMHKLIGFPHSKSLPNSKLEILRCFATAAWTRAEIPTRHMRAMFSAGFSSNDVARIIDYIAAIRGVTPEVEAWP